MKYRIKTKDEFIREFGECWRSKAGFNDDGLMDYLCGTLIDINNMPGVIPVPKDMGITFTDVWSISPKMCVPYEETESGLNCRCAPDPAIDFLSRTMYEQERDRMRKAKLFGNMEQISASSDGMVFKNIRFTDMPKSFSIEFGNMKPKSRRTRKRNYKTQF